MSEPYNGGPAFPTHSVGINENNEGVLITTGGMSLRDWFAGQALCGWAAGRNKDTFCDSNHEVISDACFKYADSMLKSRNQNE